MPNVNMILIVGLGNPGKKFENTRHNLGFRIIDKFAERNGFPDFRLSKKYNAAISENILTGEKILLAKPQTYMNESGLSVKKIIKNRELEVGNLIIIHDDLDLPLGKIRISIGRGSAGHKGVESIIKELGNQDFIRFRLGIKPAEEKDEQRKTEKFVLQKFSKEEKTILEKTIEKISEAIDFTLKEGAEKAMNLCNK